jgi:hypothetical protein
MVIKALRFSRDQSIDREDHHLMMFNEDTRPGKLSQNYGKIHHLGILGHFQ